MGEVGHGEQAEGREGTGRTRFQELVKHVVVHIVAKVQLRQSLPELCGLKHPVLVHVQRSKVRPQVVVAAGLDTVPQLRGDNKQARAQRASAAGHCRLLNSARVQQ